MDALAEYVAAANADGALVVQPRMGFATIEAMGAGLTAVKAVPGRTVGTITVDSFTRVNDHGSATRALAQGTKLNGFPLVSHGARAVREMVDEVAGDGFPVQVRHGSALPWSILAVLLEAGITATEGGPVSYCLPYSRLPIRQAVKAWADGVELCASRAGGFHLESFGGCLLGQLCPPGLLVAVAILEGLFFRQHGITSISFGYTQQTSFEQDAEALAALRRLAAQLLPDVAWHVVLYTCMGLFPRTRRGAQEILGQSVHLALRSGSERLIVKTAAESVGIPEVAQNIDALEYSAALAARLHREGAVTPEPAGFVERSEVICREALALIEATLDLSEDVGEALARAVLCGYLDVPFCLHPDNAKLARSALAPDGRVEWAAYGKLPLAHSIWRDRPAEPTSDELLRMLAYNRHRFDAPVPSP